MRIIRTKDYGEMSRRAADILAAQILLKPDCVLGLATGSSPIGIYEHLIRKYKNGDLRFAGVRTVNLDEYKGLGPTHTQSYRYFMEEHLFRHVDIDPANTHVPDGLAMDDQTECSRYDEVIRQMNGVDLQLLGLGHNGHIGFNEPSEGFAKDTHCVRLAERTIRANARLFDRVQDVPRYAYTMGIGTILRARKIVLVVSGREKAQILWEACHGPVTPAVPASILQLHPDVTVVADRDALALEEEGEKIC